MHSFCFRVGTALALMALGVHSVKAQGPGEEQIVRMLQQDQPYHAVSPEQFEQLGWDLPDGGSQVKALADAAPGGALDPRKLETLPADQLGYQAKWHEVRYKVYGLDWDIPGLHLTPNHPLPGMPTLVIIHGGSANWYEFFLDPLNRPGLGQYLAQKIPVLLVTIPGNYRHGGWTETEYENRIPGYLLDRDVPAEERKIRNAVYTFRVVTDGVKRLVETVTTGPVVLVGHSTGGEIQFILKDSSLQDRMQGLSFGWGTGGPAALSSMREFRGVRSADDYLDVWEIRPRPAEGYSRGYLGPLNPVWNSNETRLAVARRWMGLEERRRPQFKQILQSMEHSSADNLREHTASQIRQALQGNQFGVNPDEVAGDLFSTMRSAVTGYQKMIWTVAMLDDGHWDEDPSQARELRVANEFRKNNPNIPIRVLVFDVPMTHYGHIEKPRQLAGGLLAALKWLMQP
ncbi:MAG: alpha/beta fold hydrolase [Acidobacteria bacterium]|nr:alpha/beta fold hydrolase [Acidobacteriota bacterium]